MKRADHIGAIPLPEDFETVIAETSHVDLRMVPSGAKFIDGDQTTVTGLDGKLLLVASNPEFLRTALERVNGADSDVWIILADTGAQELAVMLEENQAWTVTARAMNSDVLVLQVRPSRPGDHDLADVITGLRLAAVLEARRPEPLNPEVVSLPAPSSMPMLNRVKRRIPRRVKSLVKKALARK